MLTDSEIEKFTLYAWIGVLVVCIILGFFLTHLHGYREGYTYVLEYKDNYIENHCTCFDPEEIVTFTDSIINSGANFQEFLNLSKLKEK